MNNKSVQQTRVTMRDVAREAGVSRMTVSRALKKNSSVSEKTRKHILDIVRKMNYVPDEAAGSLKSLKSGFVAALVPSLNNLHFAKTVQCLTEELESVGLRILLGHTDYSPDREEEILETLLRRRPQAVVLSYDGHTERTIELLQRAAIPVVEIWETPEKPIQHTIGFSNFDAAKTMTEGLIAKGYRNIAFMGEEADDASRGEARRWGFIEAMKESRLPSDRTIKFGKAPASMDTGAEAAKIIMEQYPDTDCIFCVSDLAAFGVQSYLIGRGIKVPDEIGVVGFGNFEVSRYASPAISTVVVNPDRIGRETGKLIKKLLDPEFVNSDAPFHIHVEAKISYRASTDR